MRCLSILMIFAQVAQAAPVEFASPAALVGPDLQKREAELRHYFEGCNTFITETLHQWKLKRDAGDRPTPIQMMGMGVETKSSGDVKFTIDQQNETWNDPSAKSFLEKLYVQAFMNTEAAYIRLLAQYMGQRPDPSRIADAVCNMGSKCSSRVREAAEKVANVVVRDLDQLPTYTPETAAQQINQFVKGLNDELYKIRLPFKSGLIGDYVPELKDVFPVSDPLSATKLGAYTRTYFDGVTKDGPLRLLAVPILNETVGTLQTPNKNRGLEGIWMEYVDSRHPEWGRIPARWSNGYGTTVRSQLIHLPAKDRYAMMTPHGYVTPAQVGQAFQDAKKYLEDLIAEMNVAASTRQVLEQATIREGINLLIGTNALAAHSVLLSFPELKPSACRAFKDFAIDRARSHRTDRYKNNALVTGGAIVAALGVILPILEAPATGMLAPILAPLGATAEVGVITEVTGDIIFSTTGLIVSGAAAADAWRSYAKAEHKLNLNVAEVLGDNEAPEIIITRIPEQISAYKSAYWNRLMSTGFAVLSASFVVKDLLVVTGVVEGSGAMTAARAEKEAGIGTGKLLFSLLKFGPIIGAKLNMKELSLYENSVIKFEDGEDSGNFIFARVGVIDTDRGYVKLTLIKREDRFGKELPPEWHTANMDIELFRGIINGFTRAGAGRGTISREQ